MKNKRKSIIVILLVILAIILTLWISGVIPKQIARIAATQYLKNNFPKLQLEYVNIEWSSSFGGYTISFKDQDNKTYGFIMNSKYFPISPGQGIFAIQEEYRRTYGEPNKINWEEQKIPDTVDNISIEIKNGTLTKQSATIRIVNKNISQAGYEEWFRIDKKQDNEWKELGTINKNYIFNDLAYILKGESNSEQTVDWSNLYGRLSNGQYRFVKKIKEKYIAVEFTID